MLPRNYLLTAPIDAESAFGRGMTHSVIEAGLRKCNLAISVPLPDSYPGWYPGKANGMTTIWLGPPFVPTSRKICAFHIGMVPEFSQTDDEGNIIRRGWRSIFEKVIRARATTKRRIEKEFGVVLDYGAADKACWKCRIEGRRRTATSKNGVCDWHSDLQKVADRTITQKEEVTWLKHQDPTRIAQYLTPESKPSVLVKRSSSKTALSPSARTRRGKTTSRVIRSTKST